VRSTSNPAFRNLPRGNAAYGQYGSNVGFDQPGYNQPGYGQPGYGARPAGDDRPMTVDDVVVKTGMSIGVALITGVITAVWARTQVTGGGSTGAILGVMFGAMIVGLIISLVIIFKQIPSGPLTLSYSAVEGVFLGALTGIFQAYFGTGIALQALIGTAGVFVAMLVVYKTGAVKVTPKLTKWIIGATMGAVILMLVNLVLSLFGVDMGIRSGGPLSIAFSLLVIGIAAFNFLLDFDMADKMIRQGMPAKWAWYAAFGLMTTLVWLYLEILRLLSYLQRS
jgi:uncharacterized YccA/Bax inhibitor family protein